VREVTDRQKDRHTDTGDFIICPMLCYSNGTDKNRNKVCRLSIHDGKLHDICDVPLLIALL